MQRGRNHWILLATWVTLAIVATAGADWQGDLAELSGARDHERRESLVRSIAAKATCQEIADAIRALPFPEPPVRGDLHRGYRTGQDDVNRPYVLYIPSGYRTDRPAPMLVYMHGGVSRETILEDPEGYARENPFLPVAEERGWLLLFPFGQRGATWWDEVGMENVLGLVRRMKSEYNVDDDRVWLSGFSDGGSGSYLFSMLLPTDFAAFVPLNGHMGVGSLDGGLHCYPNNMANSTLYAVNTELDRLYPTEQMEPMVRAAQRAGANIVFRSYPGIGHDFDYAAQELPRIVRFLERHPRDPLPPKVDWEAAHRDGGRCHWLWIERVAPRPAEEWHVDHNYVGADESIVFGFRHDPAYEGSGMRVNGLVSGDSLCRRIGIQPGDVLIKCDGVKIRDVHDLNQHKTNLRRGQTVTVTVRRDGRKIERTGRLPDPVPYLLFPRERPSARAIAEVHANRVEIQGSRVGRLSILVHPDQFHVDEPVTVMLNGKHEYRQVPGGDPQFLLRSWLENRDRHLLYWNRITIEP